MKIGLIGLNQTGKTTLFDLLSGKKDGDSSAASKSAASTGTGMVPDKRVDFLSEMYNPKKTTYARIEFTDIAGFSASNGQKSGASKFLNDVRPCDAITHVLRGFESDAVFHDLDSIDPLRDLILVESEMLLADMELIERRIERIKAGKKVTKELSEEIDFLERVFDWLEGGGAIRDIRLNEQEETAIRGYSFLTEKPRLAVLNMSETQWENKTFPNKDELTLYCEKHNIPIVMLCAQTELEISRLPDEDKLVFMDEMGITEPGIYRLSVQGYRLLDLISFFTVGSDEVKAWTIENGLNARKAAGKIHTDIERGFIRAEVTKYSDLFEFKSMAKLKEKGLFRLEGKDYTVADGDIINFRFNV